jgi:protocatechuate 3,4-dioxygenase beta subunit
VRQIDLDDDDALVGRVLTRREVLVLFGAAAGGMAVAACAPSAVSSPSASGGASATGSPTESASGAASAGASASDAVALPSCVVRPELTEGPYFLDQQLERSDIRTEPSDGSVREGTPLTITYVVSRIDGSSCEAFEGAVVDVWHCDALGAYSGVDDPGFQTAGQQWLRGYQVTGADGVARFLTIYPGWYRGRAVHIHFKIRTDPGATSGLGFTSQLFFDDSVSDVVHAQDPYAQKGQRDMRNADDGIYQNGGDQLLLAVRQDGDGYAGTFDIGVQVA